MALFGTPLEAIPNLLRTDLELLLPACQSVSGRLFMAPGTGYLLMVPGDLPAFLIIEREWVFDRSVAVQAGKAAGAG
jgi:hypothetical protein